MKLRQTVFITLLIGGLIGCQQDPQSLTATTSAYADTLLTSAKIYTVNEANPWAEAVAIKDSTIIYVGNNSDAKTLVGPNTDSHNLSGKLVIPGIVDAHTHPGLMAMLNDMRPLPYTSDKKEFLDGLATLARENPDLPVIFAASWHLPSYGVQGPHKKDLDRIVPNRPVFLMDDSGHSYWVNSKTLEIMGIDRNTPDPVPGMSMFQRDASGEPTGWIKEYAAMPIINALVKATAQTPKHLLAFIDYLSAHGVTTLFDAGNLGYADTVYPMLAKLDKEGKLPLDYEGSYHIHQPHQVANAIDELKRLRRDYGGKRLKFNTIKIHFDGVNEVRTSSILKPFRDTPENSGNTLISREQLRDFIVELNKDSIDLHLHTVADGAIRTALDAVENAQKIIGGSLDLRVTLCHLEVMADADIPRFKQLGVVANFTPHWEFNSKDYSAELQPILGERFDKVMRAQPLLNDGAVVTFSSDVISAFQYDRANPFLGMQVGHNRQDIGVPEDTPLLLPATERLNLEDMVKGYTLSGAYQLRMEDSRGSIEVGKSADLLVLNQNLFEVDRYSVHQVKPLAVVKDGELVKGTLP